MKLTIIIPTHNRASQLEKAIGSISPANKSDQEIIVVDDGSVDDTPKLCQQIVKKRPDFIYQRQKNNQGFFSARNVGIKTATGDWISFLDSDDQYLKEGLNRIRKNISQHQKKAKVIFFMTQISTPNGKKVQGYLPKGKWQTYAPSYEDITLKSGYVGDMHRCVKTKVAREYLFNPHNPGFETAHYSKIAKAGYPFLYINQPVVLVNKTDTNRLSVSKWQKSPLPYAKTYQQFIEDNQPVFRTFKEQESHYQLLTAKCYWYAKKLLKSINWLVKSLLTDPTILSRGGYPHRK